MDNNTLEKMEIEEIFFPKKKGKCLYVTFKHEGSMKKPGA